MTACLRRVAHLPLILIMLLGLTSLTRALEAGSTPPDFSLTALDGTPVSLSALKGKVVVLDFWASWCAPCKEEMPVLEKLYKKYGARGFVVVGVSVDNERENAKGFIDKMKVSFPIVHDAGHKVADKYKPPRMPTSFVLDRAGKIRFVHEGFHKEDAGELEKEISGLL